MNRSILHVRDVLNKILCIALVLSVLSYTVHIAFADTVPFIDQDHDGLSDIDEKILSTDPLRSDTDRDNYPDLFEIQKGYNPRGQNFFQLPPSTGHSHYLSVEEYNSDSLLLLTFVRLANPRVALRVLSRSITDPKIFRGCHEFVHIIGNAAYKKYASVHKALTFHDDLCGSGYLHGVLEVALSSSKNLVSDVAKLCPTQDAKCYHGIGHGFMFFTKNDLPKSLEYCSDLKPQSSAMRCSEGVFMENFSTDEDIHHSKYLDTKNPFLVCSIQKNIFKVTCYFYAPRYIIAHQTDPLRAFHKCYALKSYKNVCMTGMGSALMKKNIDNPHRVELACNTAQKSLKAHCIEGMISYLIVNYDSLEPAKKICTSLSKANKKTCLNTIASHQYLF